VVGVWSVSGDRGRVWWWLVVVLVVVLVGCGGGGDGEVEVAESVTTRSSDPTVPVVEWACGSPSTFVAVPPPPGVEGLPEVASGSSALAFAQDRAAGLSVSVEVVEVVSSSREATFRLVDAEGAVVEEVVVVPDGEGRWVLDASVTCGGG
jgi:hypothetical protein